jgi:hypothetical protein
LENALLLFCITLSSLEMPSNNGAAAEVHLLLLLLLLGVMILVMLAVGLELRLRQLYDLQGFSFLEHAEYR